MAPRLLLILIAVAGVILLLRWFSRLPPQRAAKVLRWGLFLGILAVLILLAATGRLNWLFALAASIAPLFRRLLPLALRNLPLIGGLYRQYRARNAGQRQSPGQASRIETAFLRMTLDHDTGEMNGEVLQGRYKGAKLCDLELNQLLELMQECTAGDSDSVPLLEAYLDRAHGDQWREQNGGESQQPPPPGGGRSMTRDEALAVLGLEPGASREDIVASHRRLMQKLHPDRGGSDWLAAKLNQAKDLLLSG